MQQCLYKLDPHKRMQIIMSVMKGDASVRAVSESTGILRSQITQFIDGLSGHGQINPSYHSILWKDLDLKYRDFNKIGSEYGSHKKVLDCIGKTISESSPEIAEEVNHADEKALTENINLLHTFQLVHPILGVQEAISSINPIRNEQGQPTGVFIYHYSNINFKFLSFNVIYQALNSGHANYLLNKPYYSFNKNEDLFTLSAKEMEIFLYLLIGKTSKFISNKMDISCRTVENIIYNMKVSSNFNHTDEMVSHIWSQL